MNSIKDRSQEVNYCSGLLHNKIDTVLNNLINNIMQQGHIGCKPNVP